MKLKNGSLPKEDPMLNVTVQTTEEATVLCCRGRIVTGNEIKILREAVFAQAAKSGLVIDLRHVDVVDAGGVGLLLELREWAGLHRIQLTLVNAAMRVQQVFEVTNLSQVFGIDGSQVTHRRSCGAAGFAA
jgi:anti-anti-sigma factor